MLFDAKSLKTTMRRFARFLGLLDTGGGVDDKVLSSASPASTSTTPHENGREYVAEVPPELADGIRAWLCSKNRKLSTLLLRHKLVGTIDEFGWLRAALAMCKPEARPRAEAKAGARDKARSDAESKDGTYKEDADAA